MAKLTFEVPYFTGLEKRFTISEFLAATSGISSSGISSIWPIGFGGFYTTSGLRHMFSKSTPVAVDGEVCGYIKGAELEDFGDYCAFARMSNINFEGGFNCYLMEFETVDSLYIAKYVSGSFATISIRSIASLGISVPFYYRFKVEGSDIKLKVWNDDEDEPATWNVTHTDTSITAAGVFGIGAVANQNPILSKFTIATNGDIADLPYNYISGNVKEKISGVDTAVAQKVRAVAVENHKITFETTSDAATGDFVMKVASNYTYAVYVSHDGATYNALISDRVIPQLAP